MKPLLKGISFFTLVLIAGCTTSPAYDVLIRNGLIHDGSGAEPYRGDVAVKGDRIVQIGDLGNAKGRSEIDAAGRAVTPGFINMLSWAPETLIVDGLSQSDIRQGVTLEVFGEGWSMGPLTTEMKQQAEKDQGDIQYSIEWTTLNEYLEYLTERGISTNVASFVGATTLRIHEIGFTDREPTDAELANMKSLLKIAMEEGALGLGSSLIYAPAFYAKTDELIALNEVVAEFDGMYISHIRNEGNQLLEAMDELIEIARQTGVRAEIYHLKAAGADNWHKMDLAIDKINQARAEGLEITADMYTYIAGATGLDAAMPPWVQEGGYEQWAKRLADPKIRTRVLQEMVTPTNDWESLYLAAGSPEKLLMVGFKNPELKHLTGKTLAEIARMRGKTAEETAIDLVIEDGSRVGTVYFIMDEKNIEKKIAQPWMSFGSDAESMAPEGVFLQSNPHPRAYGTFARLLGKYVREEQVISLPEAIRRLTSLPAQNLKIKDRGSLKPGYYADLVIFDPDKVTDHATFDSPHQYSTGIDEVFVNGVQVLKGGEHTGAKPGAVVRGPGWKMTSDR